MAARRRQKEAAAVAPARNGMDGSPNAEGSQKLSKKERKKQELDAKVASKKNALKNKHLAPLPLVITVMICSGALWVLAFRDVFATGRAIAGSMDDAMQHFTKSTDFFDDSRGWKSTQGGLSAIKSVTTDENNMGGLFIRKVSGAAALAVHSQKLVPLLFQPAEAYWAEGHFIPMLLTSVLGNLAISSFYAFYAEELKGAGAQQLGLVVCSLLITEAIVMLGYAFSAWRGKGASRNVPPSAPAGKSPNSITSRIAARTVSIVSGLISAIAIRDLFFPGQIITPIPRDDIYLEWTNAFIHSPPPGTAEADENGLEAPLYIGDKFISQLMALHLIISCFHKFTTAFFIRTGKGGSGEIKCRTIWRVQALGDGFLLFILRLFAPAAKSASLDLRWHLMCLGYETIILALYAFF